MTVRKSTDPQATKQPAAPVTQQPESTETAASNDPQRTSEPAQKRGYPLRGRWTKSIGLALLVGIPIVVVATIMTGPHLAIPATTHTGGTRQSYIQRTVALCPGSWKMEESKSTPTNGNFVENGVSAILNAKTNEDNATTRSDGLVAVTQLIYGTKDEEGINVYPGELTYYLNVGLHQQVSWQSLIEPGSQSLTNPGGCASGDAINYTQGLFAAMASGTFSFGLAPSDGTNSSTQNGTIIPHPGMPNNRKALEIRMPDGTTFWVLGMCGNVVTPPPPPQCAQFSRAPECLSPKSTVPVVQQGINGSGTPPSGPASPPTDSTHGCPQLCPGSNPTPVPSESPPATQPPPSPIASDPPTPTAIPIPPPPTPTPSPGS